MSADIDRVGTTYRFVGLPGGPDQGDDRTLVMHSISVDGKVCFRMEMLDGVSLISVDLLVFERLIELGVWERTS